MLISMLISLIFLLGQILTGDPLENEHSKCDSRVTSLTGSSRAFLTSSPYRFLRHGPQNWPRIPRQPSLRQQVLVSMVFWRHWWQVEPWGENMRTMQRPRVCGSYEQQLLNWSVTPVNTTLTVALLYIFWVMLSATSASSSSVMSSTGRTIWGLLWEGLGAARRRGACRT